MCKALEDWADEIRAEVIKEKDAQLEQKDVQLEQNKAHIKSMQKEIDMLRAQLASAAN